MRAKARQREGMDPLGKGMETGGVEGPLSSATLARIGDCPVTIGTKNVL